MSVAHRAVLVCVAAASISCGSDPSPGLDDGGACAEGNLRCDGQIVHTCVAGDYVADETCPFECVDLVGCVVCEPGTGSCDGNASHACAPDGSGYIDAICDPVQGSVCDPTTGSCTGRCAPQYLGTSVGCDYFPTVTGNSVGTIFDFAVSISNTTGEEAAVYIEDGRIGTPRWITVAPDSVAVETLPWVPVLKLCNAPATDGCAPGTQASGALALKGAYHLRSNQPVIVYQFNPLQYARDNSYSYSNDASLLLPANAWRDEYYVAAWPGTFGSPSLLAITARDDGTMVTITTRADTPVAGGAPAFAAGVPQTVALDAGDVLELATRTGDLTGTHVSSTAPVQVIGGQYCANVPDTTVMGCNHLEESMISVDALGYRYIVNAPATTTLPYGKVQQVRIIATAPNTSLSYDPPQLGVPTTIANPGDFVEILGTTASFLVTADQKVLVAQYMSGLDAGGGSGDPAMTLAVPVEQFRSKYLFHAPLSFEINFVDVTAPMGAQVTLDGEPLTFTAIGTSGYGLERVSPLSRGPAADGNHVIVGDRELGVTVYGYGPFTSYWYPGGLDFKDLDPVDLGR